MPYYDLHCEKCQQEFNLKASIQERSEGAIQCPSCGSNDLATVFKKVNVLKFRGKDCDVCPGSSQPAARGGCAGGCCGINGR